MSEASINAGEAEDGHDWCTHEGIDLRWKLYTSFIAGKMRENVFEQTVLEKPFSGNFSKILFFPIPIIYILEITLFPLLLADVTNFVGSFTTLTAAKAACNKYLECTGITKYSSAVFM